MYSLLASWVRGYNLIKLKFAFKTARSMLHNWGLGSIVFEVDPLTTERQNSNQYCRA